jgi:TIR domain
MRPGTFSSHDSRWWLHTAVGTDLALLRGIAGTADAPHGHFPEGFPLPTTVILGDSGKHDPRNPEPNTTARWQLPAPLDEKEVESSGSQLIISCLRRYGGLHSPVFDDRAVILLNGNVIDGFELKEKPEGHQDYFHLQTYPDVPCPPPFSQCHTIYTWPIPSGHLRLPGEQELTLRIDRDAKWDIDYIGLLLKLSTPRHRVFLSYSHRDRRVARQVAAALEAEAIPVWLDDLQIRLGDSLLGKIAEAIDDVEYVVALLSRHSIDSEWVRKELNIAMHQEIEGKRVKVIVVRLDETPLPSFLADKRYADLSKRGSLPVVVAQVVQRLAAE